MDAHKFRILLCDDHAVVLEGLRALLDREFAIVGLALDGRLAVAETRRLQPDVVVLDISIPLLNGIEAARQIREAAPQVKIIFLSQQSDPQYLVAAMRLGASGYVVKQGIATEIQSAIHEVLQGHIYISPSLRRSLPQDLFDPQRDAEDLFGGKLTPRQREVLQLLAEGKSGKEISAILNISVKTVDFHKAGIMDELGMRTTAELTRYAIRHGIA